MTRHLARIAALIAVAFAFVAPANAQSDQPISAFVGTWQGTGVAENDDSLFFAMTQRDLDVVIRGDDSGFSVEWTTVIRSGGDPSNPDVRRRTATLSFSPAQRPGMWHADTSGDPLAGGVMSWAQVTGNTLGVYQLTTTDDGFVLLIYNRTLSDLGMELEFHRLRNGTEVRTVTGRLVKIAS